MGYNPHPQLLKSNTKLIPYGGSPIIPLGKVKIVCINDQKYELLEFQVLPASHFSNKPALISGADSRKLGLVDIYAAEIHEIYADRSQMMIPSLNSLSREEIFTAIPNLWNGTWGTRPTCRLYH